MSRTLRDEYGFDTVEDNELDGFHLVDDPRLPLEPAPSDTCAYGVGDDQGRCVLDRWGCHFNRCALVLDMEWE